MAENKHHEYGILAIVAVVGLVVMFMSKGTTTQYMPVSAAQNNANTGGMAMKQTSTSGMGASCSKGFIWDGQQCVGNPTDPVKNMGGQATKMVYDPVSPHCSTGYTWNGDDCVPINRRITA